jgi:hypothetical protein
MPQCTPGTTIKIQKKKKEIPLAILMKVLSLLKALHNPCDYFGHSLPSHHLQNNYAPFLSISFRFR